MGNQSKQILIEILYIEGEIALSCGKTTLCGERERIQARNPLTKKGQVFVEQYVKGVECILKGGLTIMLYTKNKWYIFL